MPNWSVLGGASVLAILAAGLSVLTMVGGMDIGKEIAVPAAPL
jgi:hypothetical protein